MKSFLLLTVGIALAMLTTAPSAAQMLDPSFAAPTVYAPGTVYSVTEQPDGKRVVLGNFLRIDGTTVSSIARFNANGTLDAAFNRNAAGRSDAFLVRLLSNGQYLLVAGYDQGLSFGGINRPGGLLRLNADGTADASFDVGAGPLRGGAFGYMNDVVPLPNGQILVVGLFDHFSGNPASSIVRLNADGSVDATLKQSTGIASFHELKSIVAASGGKFLIGGHLTATFDGYRRHGIARLNADGSLDPAFDADLLEDSDVTNIKVQPDGRVLLGGFITARSTSLFTGLARIQADGALDNTFTAPSLLSPYVVSSAYGQVFEIQTDGKILALCSKETSSVLRLSTNGTLDATYVSPTAPPRTCNSITLLSNDKLAAPGFYTSFGGVIDRPLLQLNTDGSVDAAWQPVVQAAGSILSVVRQPDGKLLAGGSFSEINGQSTRRLARFNADGTLDAAFSTGLTTVLEKNVADIALQPDGRVLVASGRQVHRFLPVGVPDATFTSGQFIGGTSTNTGIYRVALQRDGRILVGGNFTAYGSSPAPGIARLTATGNFDASFAPLPSGINSLQNIRDMVLLPDDKLLVTGIFVQAGMSTRRFTDTGSLDATYTPPVYQPTAGSAGSSLWIRTMTRQPDGKVLIGGNFGFVNNIPRTHLARLNADGTLDTDFTTPAISGTVYSVVVQPNSRILVGGLFTSPGLPTNLARLNANGSTDASFTATAVPNNAVRTLLAQANDAFVAGGAFTTLGSQNSMALARLTAANVLHVAAPQAVADRTQAWPVPARTRLHVAPDASAHAQTLDLLDLLGRPVLHQAVSGNAPTTLAVETLPAGVYLLRVTYAEGTVTRRVQVQ